MDIKRKILLIISILLLLLSSCTQYKNKYLYNVIYMPSSTVDYTIFPVIIYKGNSVLSGDSCIVLTTAGSLYSYLNIKMKNDNFYLNLYNSIVNNDKILVDTNLFKVLSKNRIETNLTIDSLYQLTGIVGVLNKYLDNEGWLEKYMPNERFGPDSLSYHYHGQGVNIDYIMYLAAKHNIYFWGYAHLSDEFTGYYIGYELSDKQQLKGLKPIE